MRSANLERHAMKLITRLVIALSLLSFAPVAASAGDWYDTSKGGQQRWGY
jgi:hypothetical protein